VLERALAESRRLNRRAVGERRAVADALDALKRVADVANSGWTEDEKAAEHESMAAEMKTGGDVIANRFEAKIALIEKELVDDPLKAALDEQGVDELAVKEADAAHV
jgi:hypothetical protein